MSEKILIEQCSPTLAGIKTGNIFNCRCENKTELFNDIRKVNKLLSKKGIRVIPLRISINSALIYVYRIKKLHSDIELKDAREILSDYGYPVNNVNACVAELSRRFQNDNTFPHEIGFFLGYPPADVIGFICNEAKNAKSVGYWKVYGDENTSKKIFDNYKKCSKLYFDMWKKGKNIERLTIAD